MIDQVIIGDKASFDDFGASLAKPIKKNPPKKKSIKESVPFSNVTHDFSAINGEVYWEERELECVFEITADTPEQLEEKKAAFSSWVMGVMEQDIHDPFIPDYHFVGTYDDMSFDDEDGGEKTTATVKFTAYPYKVSNYAKAYELTIAPSTVESVVIVNDSNHPIIPTIITDNEIRIGIGDNRYALQAGTYTDEVFALQHGITRINFGNDLTGTCNVTIRFFEEVF